MILFFLLSLLPLNVEAKEIALTFDDAPNKSSLHFDTLIRTDSLIRKLEELKVPPVIVFSNPCKRADSASVIAQLKKYQDRGDIVGNHTCTHPRLDEIGYPRFSEDAAKADNLLAPLFSGQKFFRFPFLAEGKEEALRDKMRDWLAQNHYRNGMISVDNEDPIFSHKINQAKELGKKIDYEKVKALFLNHILTSVDFYENLAEKTLGRSPKHVLLLHEADATVLFLDALVKELRNRGWKIISAEDAYKDPMYSRRPMNTHAGMGIVAQLAFEKNGKQESYYDFNELKRALDKILGI